MRPEPGTLRQDAIAGVPGAVGSVPDGMASAVLVGVNPVYGLYASFAGPVAGGLTASTRLMVITTTTAVALAAGWAVAGFDADRRPAALFMLTVLAGAMMLAAGLLRLGRYVRFVSFSVMIGFLTGVAANIVFGQVPDLTGASATGDFALVIPTLLTSSLFRGQLVGGSVGQTSRNVAAGARGRWASIFSGM